MWYIYILIICIIIIVENNLLLLFTFLIFNLFYSFIFRTHIIGKGTLLRSKWCWAELTVLELNSPSSSAVVIVTSTALEEAGLKLLASPVLKVSFLINIIFYLDWWILTNHHLVFSGTRPGFGCPACAGELVPGGQTSPPAHLCSWRELSFLLCQPYELALRSPAPSALLLANHEHGQSRLPSPCVTRVLDLAPVPQVSFFLFCVFGKV